MAKGDTANKKEMEKRNDVWEVTEYAAQQLIEKQKEELPKYIKKRKREFVKELEKYEIIKENENEEVQIMNKTIPMFDLIDLCFSPFVKVPGKVVSYSASELMVIFDFYKECIKKMNRVEIMPPTKEQFCQLCGFSTESFDEMRNSGTKEVREILSQVNDWICNYLNIGGLTRKISEVSSIYQQKVLGKKEVTETQQPPQQNNIVIGDNAFMELYNKFLTKK